jgi:glycogen debranching enzyme
VWCLGLVALLTVGAVACRPAPQNWHYNTVRQAHSTATFGVHHVVEYRYNGRRIETLSNKCAADNWYSGLRYTGYCTAKARHGRLEVEWGWVWVKGSPPIARSQSYVCAYNVSVNGKITRLKTGLLDLPCSKFQP